MHYFLKKRLTKEKRYDIIKSQKEIPKQKPFVSYISYIGCVKRLKKLKKNFKNPLTNQNQYDIIEIQKESTKNLLKKLFENLKKYLTKSK